MPAHKCGPSSHRRHMQATVISSDTATLQEIDEALTYAQQLSPEQRGPGWHAFVDRLLELRAKQNPGGTMKPTFQGPNNRAKKGAQQ